MMNKLHAIQTRKFNQGLGSIALNTGDPYRSGENPITIIAGTLDSNFPFICKLVS